MYNQFLSKPLSMETKTDPKIINDPSRRRAEAKAKFVENISITGLLELYYAPNKVISYMWLLALLISTISIFYHSTLLIIFYLNQQAAYETLQTDQDKIPFPKVYICSPGGFNKTEAMKILRFPPKERKMFEKLDEKGKQEMMMELVGLLSANFHFILEKNFSPSHPRFMPYFHIMQETFKNISGDTTGLYKFGMLPPCHRVLSNCIFRGQQFDCCQNSTMQIDEDGPCYDLQVDKLGPVTAPLSLTTPISLTYDLTMEWNYILPYSSSNGFTVHIDDPPSPFSRPVAVSAGAHAMIDVSNPIKRIDKNECNISATTTGEYDSQGHICKYVRYIKEVVGAVVGCQFAFFSYTPNKSELCNAAQGMAVKMGLAYGVEEQVVPGIDSKLRAQMFDIIHSSTACLPKCTKWEYTARPSFSEMRDQDFISAIGENETGNVSMSRVTVFIGSSYYISVREIDTQPFYKTFMLITDVLALYMGGSVIAMIEIVVYSIQLGYKYWKIGHKRNKVEPL